MADPKAPQQQWIPMVNPDTGLAEEVHPSSAQAAASKGWTVETPEERKVREYQQTKGGSVVEGAKALGEHALGSATLGLSDWALSHDPEYREQRQLREQTFKAPGVVGDVAGFLVPGIGEVKALGTAGKAAKAISAPVGTAGKIAAKAGSLTERALAGAAPGTARSVAAKVAGGAVAGGLEGAAIGAGQALSDASIHDKELTAELLLSHVREGATIGGVLGGGLSGGIGVLSAAGKGLSGVRVPGISDVLGGSRGLGGLAETKALTSFGALGSDIKRIVKEGGADAPHRIGRRILEEAEFSGQGAMGRAVRHDLESATEIATERVGHYTERLRDVYRKLDDSGQRIEASTILREVDEKVLGPLRASKYGGDASIARSIESDLEPLVAATRRADDFRASRDVVRSFRGQTGELYEALRVGSGTSRKLLASVEADAAAMRKHFDSLGQNDAIRELNNVTGNLRSAFLTVERRGAWGPAQATRIENARSALDRLEAKVEAAANAKGKATLTYQELWALRKRVDKDITNWTATASPNVGAYRDLREVLKGQIEAQAGRTGLAKEFAEANAGASDWIKVQKIAQSRAGAVAGNRSVSLTDTIVGSSGLQSLLSGSPAGVLGLAGVGVNKFIRSAAGDRVMATLAGRYSNWRKVVEATDKAALATRASSRATVEAYPIRAHAVGFSSGQTAEYERAREQIVRDQQNPEEMLELLTAQLGPMREVSPELADATIQAGARGRAYLVSIMPQPPGYPDLKSMADKHGFDIPDSEKARFLRSLMAVDKPTSILADVRAGTLTVDKVQAVQASAPALYDAMRASIIETTAKSAADGRIPTYERRLQLSMLTGVPMDSAARPDVIAAYQAVYAEGLQERPPQPPMLSRASGKAPRFASRRESFTDREV